MLALNEEIKQNVLGKIIAKKQIWIEKRKLSEPLESFIDTLEPSDRSLAEALTSKKTAYIMECKKASPSKGLIRPNFDPKEIASVYSKYAQAVSVLAEEDFFQGNMQYITVVRDIFPGPVICKDFIIDPYQIYLARKYKADAILLMLSVLPDESYRVLAETAEKLGLDVLTETSNEAEVERAIKLGAKICGINNRNLRNLTVDLSTTERLAGLIPNDRIKVCESGIYTNKDVRQLAPLVNGFLVGSSLTAQKNIDLACRRLVYGDIKVCGLTRNEDAKALETAGCGRGGLIMWPKSKRNVTIEQATAVKKDVNMEFTGVFVDENLDQMVNAAKALNLKAVQLHGNEQPDLINQLRDALPNTEIWKAIPVSTDKVADALALAKKYALSADKILLDTKHNAQFGGTGKTFNWEIISEVADCVGKELAKKYSELSSEALKDKAMAMIILAGGLSLDNAEEAISQMTGGLDFNSGIEEAPGIKDHNAGSRLFEILRNY